MTSVATARDERPVYLLLRASLLTLLCAPSRGRIKLPDRFNRPIRSVPGGDIERQSDIGTALCEFHLGCCIQVFTRKGTDAKFPRQPQAVEKSFQFRKECLESGDIGSRSHIVDELVGNHAVLCEAPCAAFDVAELVGKT